MSQRIDNLIRLVNDFKQFFGVPDAPSLPTGPGGYASGGDSASMGVHNSGSPVLMDPLKPGHFRPVCKCIGPEDEINRGLATVHVAVTVIEGAVFGGPVPNQKILLRVSWGTGKAGGTALVDCPRGTVFTINGQRAVQVEAALVNMDTNDATNFVAGNTVRIEATVQWGSTTFQPAYFTSPRQLLTGEIAPFTSSSIPIPDQARKVGILFSNIAAQGIVVVQNADNRDNLYTGAMSASPTLTGVYVDDKLPIVSGAETIEVLVDHATQILPVWELWL